MRKNKYYDYAFNIKGYPDECSLYHGNGLVFKWDVDFNGVALIPYEKGLRSVSIEKPDPPNWDNDGKYASKSLGAKANMIGLLGEFVVLDLLESVGLVLGEDLKSLNYRINPDSPSKSWGINIPDIEVVEGIDRHYIEVKSSTTNKVSYKVDDIIKMRQWCNIAWHEGDLKVIGVEFHELPIESNYDLVLVFHRAYILPDKCYGSMKYADSRFTNLAKHDNPQFIPNIRLRKLPNFKRISEYLFNIRLGF